MELTYQQKEFLLLWKKYFKEPRDWGPKQLAMGTSGLVNWFRWLQAKNIDLAKLDNVLRQFASDGNAYEAGPTLTKVRNMYKFARLSGGNYEQRPQTPCAFCFGSGYAYVLVVSGPERVVESEQMLRDVLAQKEHLYTRPTPCRCSHGEMWAAKNHAAKNAAAWQARMVWSVDPVTLGPGRLTDQHRIGVKMEGEK